MRVSAVLPMIAGVILGGVALAQPGLVLDPWARQPAPAEQNSWFAPEPAQTPAEASRATPPRERTAPELVVGPTLLRTATEPSTTNTPSALPEASPPNAHLAPSVVDPWAASPAPQAVAVAPETIEAFTSDRWPTRVVEVVDPWNRAPSWSHTLPFELLVDPWRH